MIFYELSEFGICPGIKSAIKKVKALIETGKNIVFLKPLAHNEYINNYLIHHNLGDKLYVISAHGGTTPFLNSIDCTCSFLLNVDKKIKKAQELGYKVVYLGDSKHDEVQAMVTKHNVTTNLEINADKIYVFNQSTFLESMLKKELLTIRQFKANDKEIIYENTTCPFMLERIKRLSIPKKEYTLLFFSSITSQNGLSMFSELKNKYNESYFITCREDLMKVKIKKDTKYVLGSSNSTTKNEIFDILKSDDRFRDDLIINSKDF